MLACYHQNVSFEDPAFGKLRGDDARYMWQMLLDLGKGKTSINHTILSCDDQKAVVHWEARYPYGKKSRPVVNHVEASLSFKDGFIHYHKDDFNLWKWSRMALGVPGYLLGWSPFMKAKIQQTTSNQLSKYKQANKLISV